jgi:hypothetical protein
MTLESINGTIRIKNGTRKKLSFPKSENALRFLISLTLLGPKKEKVRKNSRRMPANIIGAGE